MTSGSVMCASQQPDQRGAGHRRDLGIDRPTNSITQSIYNSHSLDPDSRSALLTGRSVPDAKYVQFCGHHKLGPGCTPFAIRRGVHACKVGQLFPQTFNGQLFFTNTAVAQRIFKNWLSAHRTKLRRGRSLQSPVPHERFSRSTRRTIQISKMRYLAMG